MSNSRKGDYHRYLAEFATGNDRKEAAEKSLVAYKNATDLAAAELPSTHPIRLGLALNFSVFYYEILNSPDRACRLASLSFHLEMQRCFDDDPDSLLSFILHPGIQAVAMLLHHPVPALF